MNPSSWFGAMNLVWFIASIKESQVWISKLIGKICTHASILCWYFSYSGPGILGYDGKKNTAQASARGRENCCFFY